VAARKVEAIAPISARSVPSSLAGRAGDARKRRQLDTARAERDAQASARELPIERKLRDRIARLHAQLVETREVFHLSPPMFAPPCR